MPLFVHTRKIKEEAAELSHCLLTGKPSEQLITTKVELLSANTIQLFPAQAAYLDASSCYPLKNSTSLQYLNAVYLAELNYGLVLHIRDQNTASYTAYIDPFTQIQWETIFDIFKKNSLDPANLKLEVQLGFINIQNSINFELTKQIVLKFSQSLQSYLKNKSLTVNISAIYHLTNSELLDSANCANIFIDATTGTLATCQPLHNCYYPFTLAPWTKEH